MSRIVSLDPGLGALGWSFNYSRRFASLLLKTPIPTLSDDLKRTDWWPRQPTILATNEYNIPSYLYTCLLVPSSRCSGALAS